jgi:hypothetical protein
MIGKALVRSVPTAYLDRDRLCTNAYLLDRDLQLKEHVGELNQVRKSARHLNLHLE